MTYYLYSHFSSLNYTITYTMWSLMALAIYTKFWTTCLLLNFKISHLIGQIICILWRNPLSCLHVSPGNCLLVSLVTINSIWGKIISSISLFPSPRSRSVVRKYHNLKLQTNPRHCEEKLQDIYSNTTSNRQKKQSNQLLLPRQEDCKTKAVIK